MGWSQGYPNGWNKLYHLYPQHHPNVMLNSDQPEHIIDNFDRWYLVDRWGRRAILLSGAVVVSLP